MGSKTKIQQELQRLGASRIEALLVAHLLKEPETTTAAIIAGTGLRQPEVSVGVRQLRSREWLMAEPVPKEGKGRPMHRYIMQLQAAQVVDYYTAKGRKMVSEIESAIRELAAAA